MLIPNDDDEFEDDAPSAAAENAYLGPNDDGWNPACGFVEGDGGPKAEGSEGS